MSSRNIQEPDCSTTSTTPTTSAPFKPDSVTTTISEPKSKWIPLATSTLEQPAPLVHESSTPTLGTPAPIQSVQTSQDPLDYTKEFADSLVSQSLTYLTRLGFESASELMEEYVLYKQTVLDTPLLEQYNSNKDNDNTHLNPPAQTSSSKSRVKVTPYVYKFLAKDENVRPFTFHWYPKGPCQLTSKAFYDTNKDKIRKAVINSMNAKSSADLYFDVPDFS
jgi:hypothetical protein